MAAAVEIFTPVFRTPDTASPATRRRRPLALISNNTPLNDLTLNDDAAEKRQRRLSRVTSVALSSPATGTPRTQSRLDSERNMTTKSGLSNLQLKDLYSNCIKLSTENKINSKNAFGLHLIDYMQDLIKTVKEGEMTNFQVASCTLDASAKIYAGRVDSIHTQAYKMLSGLGRTENDQENQGENAADDVPGGKQRTRKAHSKPGNTIETNIKNLNVNQFDLEFEVDPLFHKTSAAFDEGGTVGLLMNNLFVRDDTCEILLDSNAVAMTTRDSTTQGQTSQDANMVDLSELREAYSNVNFEAYQICPYFSEFEFTNWNKNDEGNNAINSIISKYKNDEHAFDVDAPATEVEYPEPVAGDYSDEDMPDMGEDIEYGHDGCEAVNGGTPAAYSLANATLAFADGQEARLINSQDPRSTANTLGSLCLELSEKPNEYSYFKSSVLATWAGPEHWKMKARLSKLAGITTSTSSQDQDTKKKKARKEPFKIDFDKELDIKQYFSNGRASTTLAKSTLQNMSSLRTTLPEDLHYNADNLFRLFTKPKILVRRQAQQTEVADDGSEWYNYNNANDAANFCPDLQDDDDDHPGDAANEGQDMTCTEGVNPDMTYDITNSSQGLSFSNETAMDLTMFAGDGLVVQPNKVAKIDICYSKTAKKMDVKKLKAAMWGLLTKENPHKENMANEASEEPDLEEHEQDNTKSFKDVYEQLPPLISKNMTKNLSIPIAFVCILHLANEKCLKMLKDDEMANFGITLEKV